MARRKRRRAAQAELDFKTWGGARPGAGRPPNVEGRPGPSHLTRPEVKSRYPVQVSMRVGPCVDDLREKRFFEPIREALDKAKDRLGMRICHFSIQNDHIHLIVEVASEKALSRGMQGLTIRLSKTINRVLGRTGTVFPERYDARALTSPTRVKNSIGYVLKNVLKHASPRGRWTVPDNWVDPMSSSTAFDGWSCEVWCPDERAPPVVPPRTWLLKKGWRKARPGRIEPMVAPGGKELLRG